jgi:hypothetical protein
MKYILLSLLVAFSVSAQEGKKPERKGPPPGERPERPKLTEEQKKQRAALIAKYDTNKDGKLDKEERLKVSEEDRKNLRSFGPPGGPRGPRKDGPPPKKD